MKISSSQGGGETTVSASIKVAGVGWQSWGASGEMSGKQTFAGRTGQPRVQPRAGRAPRLAVLAAGSTLRARTQIPTVRVSTEHWK